MENENKPPTIKEVCTIGIGFPVETDEQAIEYKKKITDILAPIPNVRIDFALTSVPTREPHNAR